jgi:hypothetical protein
MGKSIQKYIGGVLHWWWVMVIGFFGGGIAHALNIWPGLKIPVWVWPVAVVLGIFVAQFLAYHKLASRLIPDEQIEKTLKRLGELRVEGVNMRNAGMALGTEAAVSNWINEVNAWQNKVISEIKKISPAEAEIFRTVDIIKAGVFENPVNEKHQKYLRVLSDRTENIKKLVQKFTPETLVARSGTET